MPYEKVGKNEPVCIADEVPFDIPDTWEWARLSTICLKLVDGDHNPPKGVDFKTKYIMASSTNINNDTIVDLEKVRYLTEEIFQKENERTQVNIGDIFFTSVGSLGRSCVYTGGLNICFQRSVSVISTFIFNYYLKYCLDSGYVQQTIIREATGTAQKGFYLNQLAMILIPIPPEKEQQRIVEQYLKVAPLIDNYSDTEIALLNLNHEFPELLKKSILQEAIQGKLVPQDENDEPASVLLERIRAEKARLVKEGKIKKNKNESVVFRRDNSHYEKRGSVEVCIDDEIPFEIPENWCWSRLSTLCKSISDGDHQPPPQVSSGIPFVVISNVSSGKINLSNTRFVPHDYYASLHESRIPCRDDLLFTVTGSYGIVIPVDIDEPFCFQRHIALLKPLQIATEFLSAWLDTPVVYEQCKHCATGTAQKTVGLNSLKNILIPVPPINEQVRILKQLQKVLPSITL